jgi:ribonuclease-3 family protein
VSDLVLRTRSIRTLAWLGDVEYEREVRWRIARRGDWPTQQLDTVRADLVRSEAQAAMLAAIEEDLSEEEHDVVRRARNARVSGSGRSQRNIKDYRAASGLEALVAHWAMDPATRGRFEAVIGPRLEEAIEEALAKRVRTR